MDRKKIALAAILALFPACELDPGPAPELEELVELERVLVDAQLDLRGEDLVCNDWDLQADEEPCVEWIDLAVDAQPTEPQTHGSCTTWTMCWLEPIGIACPLQPGQWLYSKYCSQCENCGAGNNCTIGGIWFAGYQCRPW